MANGALRWSEELVRLAEAARPLLAADGGGDHLARIGLRPDLLIGDLDSVSEGTRAWIGEERVVFRPDQDRTDLEKALIHAFDEQHLPRLTVLGALGGRPDHEVGNLGLLARRALGDRLLYRGEESLILATARPMELEAVPGETWSFWTYDPGVLVTLEGVRWPLHQAPLDAAGRPSVSNQATASRIRITPHGGPVLIMRWLTLP